MLRTGDKARLKVSAFKGSIVEVISMRGDGYYCKLTKEYADKYDFHREVFLYDNELENICMFSKGDTNVNN